MRGTGFHVGLKCEQAGRRLLLDGKEMRNAVEWGVITLLSLHSYPANPLDISSTFEANTRVRTHQLVRSVSLFETVNTCSCCWPLQEVVKIYAV